MARHYPTEDAQLEGIPGIGERKRAEFGALFTAEIAAYLAQHSRQAFND
jgi:ATP-dependent DNA helicase RecQ